MWLNEMLHSSSALPVNTARNQLPVFLSSATSAAAHRGSAEQTETLTITASVSWPMSCDQARVRNTASERMRLRVFSFFFSALFYLLVKNHNVEGRVPSRAVCLFVPFVLDGLEVEAKRGCRDFFWFSRRRGRGDSYAGPCLPAGQVWPVSTNGGRGCVSVCVCVGCVCVTSLQRSMSGHG